MTWQVNLFASTYIIASILAGVILGYTLRHRQVKGAVFFVFLTSSVIIWAFFQALEYAVFEISAKILFAKFQYLGIATIGVTWYLFAVNYNRKENWLTRHFWILLIVPAITIVSAFTNERHHLLWTDIQPASPEPGANLIYSYGPVFWLIFIYNYIALGLGTVLLIRTALNSKDIYRWQMIGLIASAIIPWVGNLVYVSGLSPVPGLDLTPLGFTASVLAAAWSIFFLRLLDLLPVAYDQVVANLTDGVMILDVYHRVADANLAAREMLRVERERLIGRSVLDVLQPWPGLAEFLRGVDLGQFVVDVEDERIRCIDIRISALLDKEGTRVGRIAIFRDISQTRKMEQMRAELAQAIVSDLRNPLTAMSLDLESLRRQAGAMLPRGQLEVIDQAQITLQQTLDQVDSILDIYRMQGGEMPIEPKPTSLRALADEVLRGLAALANKKRILLQTDIPEGMPLLMADPALLRRVIQSLLGNSIRQSREGRIVRLNSRYAPNGEVVISVIDSAEGITLPLGADLFRANFQTQSAGGLSLAFCRLAIEAHKGKIWLDDTYQEGTKISFSLPIAQIQSQKRVFA